MYSRGHLSFDPPLLMDGYITFEPKNIINLEIKMKLVSKFLFFALWGLVFFFQYNKLLLRH